MLTGTSLLPQSLVYASASAVAELASCLVLAPAEVIKQNAQMLQSKGPSSTSSSMQAFRHLASEGSARRLFTGYTALAARNLPFTALQFPVFEHVRSRLQRRQRQLTGDNPGLGQTFMVSGMSAASAGSIAAFITTPSDVVKTRMMLSAGGDEGKNGSSKSRKGAWTVAREVWSERGVKGFFRGGAFRSAWTALGSGLYLGTYDVAKVWLEDGKKDREDGSV
jgi:hypothetical protein